MQALFCPFSNFLVSGAACPSTSSDPPLYKNGAQPISCGYRHALVYPLPPYEQRGTAYARHAPRDGKGKDGNGQRQVDWQFQLAVGMGGHCQPYLLWPLLLGRAIHRGIIGCGRCSLKTCCLLHLHALDEATDVEGREQDEDCCHAVDDLVVPRDAASRPWHQVRCRSRHWSSRQSTGCGAMLRAWRRRWQDLRRTS